MCSGPLVGIHHAVSKKIQKKKQKLIFTHRNRWKIVPKMNSLLFQTIFHFSSASIFMKQK